MAGGNEGKCCRLMRSPSSFVSTARFPTGVMNSSSPRHAPCTFVGSLCSEKMLCSPSVFASQSPTKLRQTQRAGNTPLGLLGGAGQEAGSLKSFPSILRRRLP